MKHDELIGWGASTVGTASTILMEESPIQAIQACLTIIMLLISIAYTLWKWWRKASEDGKITVEEVDELMNDLKNVKEGEESDKNKR